MSSLKSLKVRIKSIKSTAKITNAMKLVAASKLKKAREESEAARPYALEMGRILNSISVGFDGNSRSMLNSKGDRYLIVVMSSDKGLCGGFNSSLVKFIKDRIKTLLSEGKKVSLYCIGKKGYDFLAKNFQTSIIEHHNLMIKKHLDFACAHSISNKITEMFHNNIFDICEVHYSAFESMVMQKPCYKQIIPLEKSEVTGSEYECEPSQENLLEYLVPKNLTTQIFSYLLETYAGEQSSRMRAMDNATRNSKDMMNKLQLVYNRTRQAQITKELIEIISGAEAV